MQELCQSGREAQGAKERVCSILVLVKSASLRNLMKSGAAIFQRACAVRTCAKSLKSESRVAHTEKALKLVA